jgi:hypothetical protein
MFQIGGRKCESVTNCHSGAWTASDRQLPNSQTAKLPKFPDPRFSGAPGYPITGPNWTYKHYLVHTSVSSDQGE